MPISKFEKVDNDVFKIWLNNFVARSKSHEILGTMVETNFTEGLIKEQNDLKMQ